MMAINVFMARPVRSHTVISDDGAEFWCVNKFRGCFKQWDQDAICERLARGNVHWNFNFLGSANFSRAWQTYLQLQESYVSWEKINF